MDDIRFHKQDNGNYISSDGRFELVYNQGGATWCKFRLYDNQAVDREKCRKFVTSLREGIWLSDEIRRGLVQLSPTANTDDYLIRFLETQELSPRACHVLQYRGLQKFSEITGYTKKQVSNFRNCGTTTLKELEECIKRHGLEFKQEEESYTKTDQTSHRPDNKFGNAVVEETQQTSIQEVKEMLDACTHVLSKCTSVLDNMNKTLQPSMDAQKVLEELKTDIAQIKATGVNIQYDNGCLVPDADIVGYQTVINLIDNKLQILCN